MIHDEATANKLLILFVLDKFETPVSEEVLLQICCSDNEWIPYLYCQQLLQELYRSGFIAVNTGKQQAVPLIAVTTDGRTCLSHFFDDIPLSLREEITEFVRRERLSYRKKQEFISDYFRNPDGTFTVSLRILEVGKPLVDLKFVVANRAVATSVHNSWKEKAPEVYGSLYDILIQ
jgi:hypothetical protein